MWARTNIRTRKFALCAGDGARGERTTGANAAASLPPPSNSFRLLPLLDTGGVAGESPNNSRIERSPAAFDELELDVTNASPVRISPRSDSPRSSEPSSTPPLHSTAMVVLHGSLEFWGRIFCARQLCYVLVGLCAILFLELLETLGGLLRLASSQLGHKGLGRLVVHGRERRDLRHQQIQDAGV